MGGARESTDSEGGWRSCLVAAVWAQNRRKGQHLSERVGRILSPPLSDPLFPSRTGLGRRGPAKSRNAFALQQTFIESVDARDRVAR